MFERFQLLKRMLHVFRTKCGSLWRISSPWSSESSESQQLALLRLLVIARREKLDPAPLVENLANEHGDAYGRRLRRLARRLRDGTALVDALEQTPDVLSDRAVLAMRFASHSGTLDSMCEEILSQEQVNDGDMTSRIRQSMGYLAAMVFIFIMCIAFLMLKIVPTLQAISNDFGLKPVAALTALVATSEHLANYWPVWFLLGFFVMWLLTSSRSHRFVRRVLVSSYVPAVARLRSSELMALLAPAVESGRPVASALSTLARYHYDRNVRMKLLFARNEIEQGADVWNSMAAAGLLTQDESIALASSATPKTQAWHMRELAKRQQNKTSHRASVAIVLFQPLMIFALAGIVLWVGFAFLQFLTSTIGPLA